MATHYTNIHQIREGGSVAMREREQYRDALEFNADIGGSLAV